MFTGLIEEVGTVQRVVQNNESAQLWLSAKKVPADLKLGDSIAVNGVCLTVVSFSNQGFSVDAVPETMRRTNLGRLKSGSHVNLERALQLSDRLGGHIVSGHVDGVGVIDGVAVEGNATILSIAVSPGLSRYIAPKGSICVDGISLTVMDVTDKSFRVSIIPHTSEVTTLSRARPGLEVNLECDVLAKYVERLLFAQSPHELPEFPATAGGDGMAGTTGVTTELLHRTGFI